MDYDLVIKLFMGVFAVFAVFIFLLIICSSLRDCYNVLRGNIDPAAVAPVLLRPPIRSRERQQQPGTDEAVGHDNRTRRRRRRRNSRDGTTTSDDTDNNEKETQSDTEAAGERPVADSNNDSISGTPNIGDKRVTFKLGEEKVVYSSSRDESGNTSNITNDSGVKCESGDDTNDHDDVSGKHDTTGGGSVGGSRTSLLPWYDFY